MTCAGKKKHPNFQLAEVWHESDKCTRVKSYSAACPLIYCCLTLITPRPCEQPSLEPLFQRTAKPEASLKPTSWSPSSEQGTDPGCFKGPPPFLHQRIRGHVKAAGLFWGNKGQFERGLAENKLCSSWQLSVVLSLQTGEWKGLVYVKQGGFFFLALKHLQWLCHVGRWSVSRAVFIFLCETQSSVTTLGVLLVTYPREAKRSGATIFLLIV